MNVDAHLDQPSRSSLRSEGSSAIGHRRRSEGDWKSLEQRQFVGIQQALARHGGLVTGDDLAILLRAHCDQPLSVVARWIVTRRIISIAWHAETLIPKFQFHPLDLSMRRSVSRVSAELQSVFDDWELALWFTQPNGWLDDTAPVDLVGSNASAVAEAARADCFIARG